MKYNTGNEPLDLGFQNPTPGISIMQIQEGIKLNSNEENETKTLMIPLQIVKVQEGDAANLEKKCTIFVNLVSKDGKENTFGEKTICSILSLTGLADDFEKKFPGDTSFTDEAFIGGLMIKLPQKVIEVKHGIRENDGKEYFEALRIMKVLKKDTAVDETPAANNAAESSGDDW